jgi:ATP-binding cassette subfamily F protein uup
MTEPNVLLLDEPTNDLDVETLNSLEDLLDDWPGSVCLVSHDRWFLERTCDVVVALLGDGSLAALPGGVEEYLARRRKATAGAPTVSSRRETGDVSGTARARAARKDLVRLERVVERLTREEAALHDELARNATDHAAVLALDDRLRAVVAERQQAEDAWLSAAELADG